MTTHPPRRSRSPRRRIRSRPATVLAIADAHGDGELPRWLHDIIRRLVTWHTHRHDHVLLLTPPHDSPAPVLLPVLAEAAQSIARLGRPAEVRTAEAPHPTPASHPRTDRSGPGPAGADQETGGPARASLTVTLADPQADQWAGTVPWTSLISPTGVLAFITHSYCYERRYRDPEPFLTRTANQSGLALLDRLTAVSLPTPGTPTPQPRHPAHVGILLFTRPRTEPR